MATEYKLSLTASEIDEKLNKIDNLAKKSEIPTKVSELENDAGFITKDDIPEGSGGVSSWNDLEDKPFGESVETVNEPLNITWDGNTEGLVSIADIPLYKVSDLVLTDEQIKTATVTLSNGNAIYIGDIWENMVSNEMVAEDYVVFPEAAAVFVRKDNIEITEGLTFTQKGIYFFCNNDQYITSFTTTEPVERIKTVIKKISGKYVEGMGYVEKSVVLPNHTLVNGVDNGRDGVDFELPGFELKKDEDYILCLNGTDYLVTAEYERQGINAISLKIDGEKVINISTWGGGATCRVYYGSNVSTISICEAAETIHPIDTKYLPETGGGIKTAIIKQDGYDNALAGIAPAMSIEETNYTCENMTFEEAKQIMLNGEPLAVTIKAFNNFGIACRCSPNVHLNQHNGCIVFTDAMENKDIWWGPKGISTNEFNVYDEEEE